MSENKYPIGGYAPGNYQCKCSTCEKSFFGDKQAVQCEPCALASLERFNALSPAEQEEVLKRNAELVNEMFENLGKMTNIKQKIFNILLNHTYANRTKAADELTELFEREAKPAGAVWVKASDRLPGWDKLAEWRFAGKEPTAKETVRFLFSAANLHQWEWLDESGTASNKDVIEFAEWISSNCKSISYDTALNHWNYIYKEDVYTTAQLLYIWQRSNSNP